MKRVLPVLLIALLLGGCYTEFLTTEREDTTDSPPTWYPPPPPPLPPPRPIIIEVPVRPVTPAPAPTETRRDFGSTRGSTEQNSTGRSNSGGKTEGRGR
jgi:hypothetical protein